jgi:RNA polymerase sigma factor (TIGR02999 family)
MGNVTKLIADWQSGSKACESELLKLVYPVMRAIAGNQLRHQRQWTLRPTELANDVYMKLRSDIDSEIKNSAQLYSLVARMIRFEIVDHIRRRLAQKRGSEIEFVKLEFVNETSCETQVVNPNWIALDCALKQLELDDPRHATLVELRYFMGLSIKESAELMQISTATADRMWAYSRAFLANQMNSANVTKGTQN